MPVKVLLVCAFLLGLPSLAMGQYVEEPDAPTTPEGIAARVAELKSKTGEALTAGNFELALMRIEAAIKLSQAPDLVANKAFILERLGQYKKSVEAFERYLEIATEGGPKVDKARQILLRLRPQLTFNSTPPGATVTQQGEKRPLGTTPFKENVIAGTALFVIERDGYTPLRHLVKIAPGTPQSVDVELERKAPPKSVAQVPAAAVESPVGLSATADDDDEGGTTLAWVGLGTAVLAGGAAGLFYGNGLEAADARDGATKSADWDSHQSSLETNNLLYLGTGSLAILAGAMGVYLFLTAPSDTVETLAVTPGGTGFSVEF